MSAGTYIREGDGAGLLLYSPAFWRDANYAIAAGGRRADFRPVRPGDPDYLPEMDTLTPGEYAEVGSSRGDFRKAPR